jgi:DNA-binding MarR family transcriptional regulator
MLDTAQPARSAPIETGRLPHLIGFLLRMAQLQFFEDFFRSLPDFRLRPGELADLEQIDNNPGLRLGKLAEKLMILQPHMTKLARRLKTRGLVERRVSPEDRRSVSLHLTAAGKSELDLHWAKLRAHEQKRTTILTAQEEATLAGLLRRLTGFETAPDDNGATND